MAISSKALLLPRYFSKVWYLVTFFRYTKKATSNHQRPNTDHIQYKQVVKQCFFKKKSRLITFQNNYSIEKRKDNIKQSSKRSWWTIWKFWSIPAESWIFFPLTRETLIILLVCGPVGLLVFTCLWAESLWQLQHSTNSSWVKKNSESMTFCGACLAIWNHMMNKN